MHKKTVLKGELREKHTRTRSSVKIAVAPKPKQVVANEEPVEAEEKPVSKKRSRKAQAKKAEELVAPVENKEETTENNE